eukprot:scaffold235113_cov39-Prasinocladus_malaysianus.AAC.1
MAVSTRPPKTPPSFGRRASPNVGEGRKRWGAPELELPRHIPGPSYADAYQEYGDALRSAVPLSKYVSSCSFFHHWLCWNV